MTRDETTMGFSRRRALGAGLGALALLAGAGGARRARSQDQDEQGDPEAVTRLQAAAERMRQVQSFRFRLTTENGVTTILEGVELESVEGAVQRPDRFQATITATVAFVSLGLEVVGIGETLWVQDPLSQGGEFSEVGFETGLSEVLNPDRLFLAAVDLIDRPTIAGETEVDGVQATVVEGEFRPLRALELAGTPVPTPSAEDQAEIGLVLDKPLFVQVWIDEEDRVIQMAFAGRLLAAEDPGIVRILRLSEFDVPVEIEPPV